MDTQATKQVVVLVEDNDTLARMYQEKLELDGFTVFTANNGQAGLELIEEKRPQVVLCDIMMPGTNGLQLLKMKNEHIDPTIREIPIIMLSNLKEDEYKKAAADMGAIHFFHKDDEPRLIVAKIKEVLSPKQAAV